MFDWIKLLVIAAALASSSVMAAVSDGTPVFSWEPPTAYENGQPFDLTTDLASYVLTCSSPSNTKDIVESISSGSTWTAPVGLFVSGDYTCSMRTIATNGTESIDGVTANFTLPAMRPNQIINFTVR